MANLELADRIKLETLVDQGTKVIEIAKYLKCHKTTIYRELGKSQPDGHYSAHFANSLTKTNLSIGRYQGPEEETIKLIEAKILRSQWSPEQISGWLRKHYQVVVSHVWIYKHVEKDRAEGGELYNHMRRGYYHKGLREYKGKIKNRVSIELRPAVVQERDRTGDIEIDLIVGPKNHGSILSTVDRSSRLCSLTLLPGKKKEDVASAVVDALKQYHGELHTITSDNGTEFTDHEKMSEALNLDYYFAHPYASYERGSIENLNGLVRQYIPKGTPFDGLTQEDLLEIQKKLNDRPRKILDYATPNEVQLKREINNKIELQSQT